MATLTVQEIVSSGLTPSYGAAAAGGDQFAWSERALLHVKNGSAASINVTITSQYTNPPDGTAKDNLVISVAAGGEKMIGPLHRDGYRDSDGNVQVGYSDVTSVTVAALKMPA